MACLNSTQDFGDLVRINNQYRSEASSVKSRGKSLISSGQGVAYYCCKCSTLKRKFSAFMPARLPEKLNPHLYIGAYWRLTIAGRPSGNSGWLPLQWPYLHGAPGSALWDLAWLFFVLVPDCYYGPCADANPRFLAQFVLPCGRIWDKNVEFSATFCPKFC